MEMIHTANIPGGQDGAFWKDYLFRFDAKGNGFAYDARGLDGEAEEPETLKLIGRFSVRPEEGLIPHFNAVVFGTEYYAPEDEFPLLYANIYNNYAKYFKQADPLPGVCCVYRLQRRDSDFSMTLVQVIRVGFTETPLWRSAGDVKDVRPYGNFVIDREKGLLYAFTMRDADRTTRYFSFKLPRLSQGQYSEAFGVNVVTLEEGDILDWFDTEYHHYIQGACCHEGKIYSTEGFDETIHTGIRIISPAERRQLLHVDLVEMGYPTEAEWIDFRSGKCYYSDARGRIYRLVF